jgi:hypothetical protein
MRGSGRQAGRGARRPTRSVKARKRPQTEGDALGGGPTKVFRLNPAPLRVLGRRRRGVHVGGAWEEGSIAPVPSSPARVLGDHPLGACFILHWSLRTSAGAHPPVPSLSAPTLATTHSDALTSSTPCDEPPLARTRPFPLSLLFLLFLIYNILFFASPFIQGLINRDFTLYPSRSGGPLETVRFSGPDLGDVRRYTNQRRGLFAGSSYGA